MMRRQFLTVAGGVTLGAALAGCGRAVREREAAAFDAATWAAERRYARTPFGDIAYVERGAGDAALFLHGFPLNGFQWRGAIAGLSPQRRCIAPDFLGLGSTRVTPGQDVGPDAQVAMLVALLDRLGVGDVDLVASDSGGAIAQLLLVRHPDRVRSILLANCDAENNTPPAALLPVIELAKAGRFVDEWLAPWLADKALARSAKGIGGMCYLDPAHPTDEAIETYFAPLVATAESKALVHAYVVALERNPLAGIRAALQRSRVPARIVWGMGDTIFAPADAAYLHASFGNSRGVRPLERYRLFWPEERPDIVAEEALALWRMG